MDTAKQAEAQPKPEIGVLYNGATERFRFKANEKIEKLLKEAIADFGIVDNQHLLSLYTEAGVELGDESKLGDTGVKAGDRLVLRPGVVKGG